MRFLPGLVVLLGQASACNRAGSAIGDGYAREIGHPSIVEVVRLALDSSRRAPIALAPWTVTSLALSGEAEQAAAFAAAPSVLAVVGHAGSRNTILSVPIYNKVGLPLIVPNATSERITDSGEWAFALVPGNHAEGEFMAQYALDSLKARRVAVVYVGDEYGIGIRDAVVSTLASRAIPAVDNVLLPTIPCTSDVLDAYRSMATALIQRSRPDVVLLASAARSAACMIEWMHKEAPETRFILSDGIDVSSVDIRGLSDSARARIHGIVFWVPGTDSLNRQFTDRLHRVLGRPPNATDALVYDAFMLAAAAIREGGTSRTSVRRYLESLGVRRPPFPGVTGPIEFRNGHRRLVPMKVVPALEDPL